MKRVLTLIVLLSLGQIVLADQYVSGYYRQNGAYVQPHYQTQSNNNTYDNYSTRGNSNPYTGQQGYVNPERAQNSYGYSNSGYSNSGSTRQRNYYGY